MVDKPVIQYAVEEAREAGIEKFIFVTGRGKHVIEDHFDHAYELEALLEAREKTKELNSLAGESSRHGSVCFTRQQKPLGLGHAVWCARHLVGNEAFAVLLPDDLMVGTPGALKQMVDAYDEVGRRHHHRGRGETPRGNPALWRDQARPRPGAITEVKGVVENRSPRMRRLRSASSAATS